MSRVVELRCSRRVLHFAVLALMSIGFAGCSADMSSRVAQDPFASRPEATASVPSGQVERRDLPQYARPQPQYQSQNVPPAISPPQSYPPASAGVSGGGRGIASYTPPAHPIETTGSVPHSVAAVHPAQGTTIIVGTSDTLEILARRYNVSPAAILQANGYRGPRVLSPGQQLIIPRPGAAVAAAPVMSVPASKPVVAAVAAPSVHVVNHGDTLMSIARRNHISASELARANGLDAGAKLKIGMKLNVPVKASAAAVPVAPTATASLPPAKMAAISPGSPQQALVAKSTNVEEAQATEPMKTADAAGALPTFRWPARGKVIAGYGAKTNGKANDGINLAVPEGTPVKAAEDGVVTYAGNELKNYGNLVLVHHSNGYVTAYAHASELLVKRGDTIKRGQVIAKSGQSGDVGSPQLHFEIRKGTAPLDPLQFLNGA